MLSKEMSDAEYEQLLGQYEYKFQKGDLVKGLVCGYDSEGAIVDIGAKTNAMCPEREAKLNKEDNMEEILKKGETYEFLIIRDEDDDGIFTVSYKKVASAYNWKQLEEIKEAGWCLGEINYDLHKNGPAKDNVMTEYEQKFYNLGNPIYKLTAHRQK